MQYAVDEHFTVNDFEVNPVIGRTETVEGFAIAFYLPEGCPINILKGFFAYLEFFKQFKLFQCTEAGNFSSADFVENYL